MEKTGVMYEKFLDEYQSEDAVRKYGGKTAGEGVSYLLGHDYANIYMRAIRSHLAPEPGKPLRLLEFGCGAGMNVTRLVALLTENRIPVEFAYGTDFSARLVQAAEEENKAYLAPKLAEKLRFFVARNEQLVADIVSGGVAPEQIGTFDFVIGVNTFRYCHRIKKELECARDVFQLLRPGGVCVNIDMNDRFPAFRSKLRGSVQDADEAFIPSLDQYESPFKAAGFQILEKKNFCWIPHSAGKALTFACRMASPVLNVVAQGRAMRSLVVARKPV